jgi:hypothetical protein
MATREATRRRLSRAACLLLPLAVSGCAFLRSQDREYVSNRGLLDEVAGAAAYRVDPSLHRLVSADVHEDSFTLQYRGVAYAGDSAWVVRFSPKSSEQSPAALKEVSALLPVIAAGRDGFSVLEEGARSFRGHEARYVRYTFDSAVRDRLGRPFPGHGIVAVLVLGEAAGTELIYQVKLDNHGDREELRWEDLEPFLAPLRG